jgi:hypothetical protein
VNRSARRGGPEWPASAIGCPARSTLEDSAGESVERREAERRWAVARCRLDGARRHVEIGVGILDGIVVVSDRDAVIGAMVARWTLETLFERRCLDAEAELPRGA